MSNQTESQITAIAWLDDQDPLPSPRSLIDPDPRFPGLLAFSDTLYPDRLLEAYSQGMFPWYSENEPVMWWCTHPRMVLDTKSFKVSHSFRKKIQSVLEDDDWEVRIDQSFVNVINACASVNRQGQNGTWITDEIIDAYDQLHHQGHVHSVESWHQGQLVGGLYCVNIGKMIYGESMFAHKTDASKIALAALSAWCISEDIRYIDCQQETKHLASLGARPISREDFLDWIESQIKLPLPQWSFDKNILMHWLKI
jgi:leucyl/phenylalanyl-tRNA--protein transferase